MITRELFNGLFPVKNLNPQKFNLVRDRDKLIDALNRILPKYGINSYLRICAFLGNCGIETDYFKTTVEYASGDAYDTRASLGNTPERDGDGRLYKGRGLSQTTGKYNYEELTEAVGKEVGIDFVKHPERLAEVEIAVLSACVFWKQHNLNKYADRGQFKELSAIVNRGDARLEPMHWAKRNELYSLCKRRISSDFAFAPAQLPIVSTVAGDSTYTTQTSDQNTQPTTGEDSSFNLPDLDLDVAQQHLNDGVEIAKRPGVKRVLYVIATKIALYIEIVWKLGLSGKVALILGAILIISSVGYVVFHYRFQIKSAASKLKAAAGKAIHKKLSNAQ